MKNLKNQFLDTNSINIYAKLQVSRFNGVATRTEELQRIKKKNTRKWPKKGPKRAKNPNFEKQKNAFFFHVPRSTMPKN